MMNPGTKWNQEDELSLKLGYKFWALLLSAKTLLRVSLCYNNLRGRMENSTSNA